MSKGFSGISSISNSSITPSSLTNNPVPLDEDVSSLTNNVEAPSSSTDEDIISLTNKVEPFSVSKIYDKEYSSTEAFKLFLDRKNIDFITQSNAGNIPATWQSQDEGISWETNDYILVLQYRPCLASVLSHEFMVNFMFKNDDYNDLFNNMPGTKGRIKYRHPAPHDPVRYDWVLCVFLKNGEMAKVAADDPVFIMTLEQVNNNQNKTSLDNKEIELNHDLNEWGRPTVCFYFKGGKHIVINDIQKLWGIDTFSIDTLSTQEKDDLKQHIIDLFISKSCYFLAIQDTPKKLGTMIDAHVFFHGEIREKICTSDSSSTRDSSVHRTPASFNKPTQRHNEDGCLSVLLIVPLIITLIIISLHLFH